MQIRSFFVTFLCFFSLLLNSQSKNDTKNFLVVLDAGHGGKDPGRPTSYGYQEKDIALDIALRVGELLESIENVSVIYTRDADIFLGLRARADIANKSDADLFVSIHCNAHNSEAHGTETYVLGLHRNDFNFNIAKKENEVIFLEDNYKINYKGFDPSSPESVIGLTLLQEDYLDQSILLASYVQNNFEHKLNRKNRGVKQAGFWVLHNTYMPSILIETGFITNKNEGDYLNSELGKKEISNSIFEAILSYKNNLSENIIYNPDELLIDTNKVNFKIQIAASSKKVALRSYNFKGLKILSRENHGKIYRYFSGDTSDYKEAKKIQAEAINAGYPKAFIVAYKNGIKISINEALKN